MKKVLFIILVIVILVAAKPVKFSEEVLFPDDTSGVLEATSKANHTTCRYFSEDYLEYLGRVDEHVGATDVLQFCLDHYGERIVD